MAGHDVHGRSPRDSLSPCSVAAHSQRLLQLNIIPPSVADSAPFAITVRCSTSEFGTVSVSSCGKIRICFVILPSLLLRNADQGVETDVPVSHDFHSSGTDSDRRRPLDRL